MGVTVVDSNRWATDMWSVNTSLSWVKFIGLRSAMTNGLCNTWIDGGCIYYGPRCMEIPCAGFPNNVCIMVHSNCWDAAKNVTTILSHNNDHVSNGLGLTRGCAVFLHSNRCFFRFKQPLITMRGDKMSDMLWEDGLRKVLNYVPPPLPERLTTLQARLSELARSNLGPR